MSGRITKFLAICAVALVPLAAHAEGCASTPTHFAATVNGEVSGQHQYTDDLEFGWTFQLRPAPQGWILDVLDQGGFNLALETPPIHSDTNPRFLYGWHFRNAANTGPNLGDVNAPQLDRRFTLNDPREGAVRSMGLGWLTIQDYGLADLHPGERARMVYLRFEACVLTPKTPEEQDREADLANPIYGDEEMEQIRACGLDLAYRPEAWVMPRMVGGDFDANGSHDFALPVVREEDGQHGIAVCRSGTWMSVLGIDEVPPGSDLVPGYFNQVEAWNAGPRDDLLQYGDDTGLPARPGDIIIIERIEKSAYSIYWDGDEFRSHLHYTYIEP